MNFQIFAPKFTQSFKGNVPKRFPDEGMCHRLKVYGPIFKYDISDESI